MTTLAQAPSSIYRSASGAAALDNWYARAVAAIGVPVSQVTVATSLGPTQVLVAGAAHAPPVIVLHGMNLNAPAMAPLIATLAATQRVYAVDIVGMPGHSSPARPDRAGAAYPEWLLEVCDRLDLRSAAFVGLSFGGWLLLRLASRAPDRVTRGVLLDSGGLVPFSVAGQLRGALAWIGAKLAPHEGLRRQLVLPAFYAPGSTPDPALAELLTLGLRHVRLDLDRAGLPPLSNAELAAIRAPMLVLYGAHDHFFDVGRAVARASQTLPHLCAAAVIAGQGHMPGVEAYQAVYGRIAAFLNADEASAATSEC